MEAPAFEEIDPADDCACPGCVLLRSVPPHARGGGAAGRPGLRRSAAAAAVTAVSATALGTGHTVPALADTPPAADPAPPLPSPSGSGFSLVGGMATPQGARAPLHGPGGVRSRAADEGRPRPTTRAEIVRRARTWVAQRVPYSMTAYWSDGYRQDCSGYVSMAWNLPGNEWTGSLAQYAERISETELQPGDILLFHNPADPGEGSHVVIFGGWTNDTHTSYLAYEQTRPHTRRLSTPYAYWENSDRYRAYRYRGVTDGPASGAQGPAEQPAGQDGGSPGAALPFPGQAYFGPGARNPHVTRLGVMLVERGARRFYRFGPGPRWTDADRRATRAFQLAQGWRGPDADGLPGPHTWRLLTEGRGRDVGNPATTRTTGPTGANAPTGATGTTWVAGATATTRAAEHPTRHA